MDKAETVFEKLAINSSPVMRLAVRLKKLYGVGTKEAIRMAKKTEKALNPKYLDKKILGASSKNRLDILQNELKGSSTPLKRGLDRTRFPIKDGKGPSYFKPNRYKG